MVLISQKDSERISIRNGRDDLRLEAHLAKVVLRLAHTGLISTTRGPGGSAVLAKKPKEISFLDIVEAIEGPLENSDCVFGKSKCSREGCIFGDFLVKMTKEAKSGSDLKHWMNFKNRN